MGTEGTLSRYITTWNQKVDFFDQKYNKDFAGNPLFGADIVDGIHNQMQVFLKFCKKNDCAMWIPDHCRKLVSFIVVWNGESVLHPPQYLYSFRDPRRMGGVSQMVVVVHTRHRVIWE